MCVSVASEELIGHQGVPACVQAYRFKAMGHYCTKCSFLTFSQWLHHDFLCLDETILWRKLGQAVIEIDVQYRHILLL